MMDYQKQPTVFGLQYIIITRATTPVYVAEALYNFPIYISLLCKGMGSILLVAFSWVLVIGKNQEEALY